MKSLYLIKLTKRKTKLNVLKLALVSILSLFSIELKAQFTASGQVRHRLEARDGQGTLLKKDDKNAYFVSQRARLNFGYSGYRFKTYLSVQDIRVFGQDASTINRTTNDVNDGFLLHEAWASLSLLDTIHKDKSLDLKIGRQEILYDDQKIIGNLDWLQQARRHDAVLLKYKQASWTADLGLAFNQNRELNSGTVFNGVPVNYPAGTNGIGNLYKSFQYLYINKKLSIGDISFLYFKDDFSRYTNVVNAGVTTKVFEEGTWNRNTTGFYFNTTFFKKLNITGNLYHQFGKDKDGLDLSANLLSITATYSLTNKFSIAPGFDFLSGNDGTKPTTENKKFDPLYGTPHKFWGYMDYFYVASGFGNQGLLNYFLKLKYNAKENLSFMLDVHGFQAAHNVTDGNGGKLSPYFGTELDLLMRYNLTKVVNVEVGYSRMFATRTLASPTIKNVADADLSPHWFYAMLTFRPNFL